MSMKQGTIVDATLIAATCSTKNKQGERDPEMHQTKKGNQWYHRYAEGFAYGMKVHNHCAEAKGYGVDTESGLIHSVQTTAANVHNLTPAAKLFHGEETVVYADAGCQGMANRPEMADKEIEFRIAMRPGKRRVLPETPDGRLLDLIETAKAHIRSKGEPPLPGDQTAVRLSEDMAEGEGEKSLQSACDRHTDQSVLGSSYPM
jgi:IS5 family transposase